MEPGEHVLHQYHAIYDGNDGFLVLSNKKITFLEQKGFFRPKYQASTEIPYQQLKDAYACTSHRLALQTREKQYYFVSIGDIYADIIVEEINNIKNNWLKGN